MPPSPISKPTTSPPTAVSKSSPSAQLPYSVFRQMHLSTYLYSLYLYIPIRQEGTYPFIPSPNVKSLLAQVFIATPIQSRPSSRTGKRLGIRAAYGTIVRQTYFFTAGWAALGATEETVASAFNLFSTASPMPFTFFSSSTDLNAPFF